MFDITVIIEAVFALLAAIITAIVIPYIKSKTTASQQAEINAWVKIAVTAAEQIYTCLLYTSTDGPQQRTCPL